MAEPFIRVGSGAPDLGIEAGTYEAVCVGFKERIISSEYGQDQPMWDWQFNILTADPNVVIPVNGLTSKFSGPQSKTYAYLTALIGKLETGQQFGEADLVGKPCWVKIEPNQKGYMRVVDVVAPPRAVPAPAPAPAPVAPAPAPVAAAPAAAPATATVSPTRASSRPGSATATRPTVRAAAGEPEPDPDDLPF